MISNFHRWPIVLWSMNRNFNTETRFFSGQINMKCKACPQFKYWSIWNKDLPSTQSNHYAAAISLFTLYSTDHSNVENNNHIFRTYDRNYDLYMCCCCSKGINILVSCFTFSVNFHNRWMILHYSIPSLIGIE